MGVEQVGPLHSAWDAIETFGIFVLLALVIGFLMQRIAQHPPAPIRATPVPDVIGRISGIVVFLFVAQGALHGLASLSLAAPWAAEIRTAALVVAAILITTAAARGGQVVLTWATAQHQPNGRPHLDEAMVPLLRLLLVVLVYMIGGLVLLDLMKVSITPLVAGLGMSGLAVALSLQPTLANFFAGTQIASDRLVKSGDYIELESGVCGYVTQVGWRSTRIRTSFNNLVVIPNSKLAESVVTNYHSPTKEVGVIVNSGVSFASDLERVECVAIEAATEVIQELPEAVSSREPRFGYDAIGESNVSFWVWVHATDRIASYRLTSELIKRLLLRFRQAGIQINYPMRATVPGETNPLGPLSAWGGGATDLIPTRNGAGMASMEPAETPLASPPASSSLDAVPSPATAFTSARDNQ